MTRKDKVISLFNSFSKEYLIEVAEKRLFHIACKIRVDAYDWKNITIKE